MECVLRLILCVSCKETYCMLLSILRRATKDGQISSAGPCQKKLYTARILSDSVTQNCCDSKLL